MQGKKHYSEKLFKQFQLSDRVPEDNFYRMLKELLDLHWLYGMYKCIMTAERRVPPENLLGQDNRQLGIDNR